MYLHNNNKGITRINKNSTLATINWMPCVIIIAELFNKNKSLVSR